MSIHKELDPMTEHRTKFAFKGKRKHTTKINVSNLAFQPKRRNQKNIW